MAIARIALGQVVRRSIYAIVSVIIHAPNRVSKSSLFGQRHTVWFRLRMLITRLWDRWRRLTLDLRRTSGCPFRPLRHGGTVRLIAQRSAVGGIDASLIPDTAFPEYRTVT